MPLSRMNINTHVQMHTYICTHTISIYIYIPKCINVNFMSMLIYVLYFSVVLIFL